MLDRRCKGFRVRTSTHQTLVPPKWYKVPQEGLASFLRYFQRQNWSFAKIFFYLCKFNCESTCFYFVQFNWKFVKVLIWVLEASQKVCENNIFWSTFLALYLTLTLSEGTRLFILALVIFKLTFNIQNVSNVINVNLRSLAQIYSYSFGIKNESPVNDVIVKRSSTIFRNSFLKKTFLNLNLRCLLFLF